MTERYTIELTESAADDLQRLDRQMANRLLKKIEWLAENAATYPHHALAGNWGGYYRLRVGYYRIIYSLDQGVLLILVIQIDHRREVYDE